MMKTMMKTMMMMKEKTMMMEMEEM